MTTPVVASPFQFRQVWRTISDGNRERHVLVLQVWEPAQEHWLSTWKEANGRLDQINQPLRRLDI